MSVKALRGASRSTRGSGTTSAVRPARWSSTTILTRTLERSSNSACADRNARIGVCRRRIGGNIDAVPYQRTCTMMTTTLTRSKHITPSVAAGGANEEIRFAVGQTSLGAILVASSAKGIASILLGDDPDALVRDLQDRF